MNTYIARSSMILGLFAVIASICSLAWGIWNALPFGFVDFPCEFTYPKGAIVFPDTRIVYCISFFPRYLSGGGIFGRGTSASDEVVISSEVTISDKYRDFEGHKIKREQDNIVVNDQNLAPGQSYTQSFAWQSQNPWVIETTHVVIKNSGILGNTDQALYVSGGVTESWRFGPWGGIELAFGILLIVLGRYWRRPAPS